MKQRNLILTAAAGLAIAALSACHVTDARRAQTRATYGDQPASIICWTYGERNFEGRSTGKVVYDDGGRLTFVDASNNRLTTVEGDCRIVY